MNQPTRFAAILLASSAAAPAVARDWIPLGVQRDGTQVTLSTASVKRQSGRVSVLVRFTPQPGAADTAGWTTFVSIDCWSASIFATRLNGGMEAAAIRPATAAYQRIKPGTIGSSLAATFCPAWVPANIGLGSVGGGPAMVMPYDPR